MGVVSVAFWMAIAIGVAMICLQYAPFLEGNLSDTLSSAFILLSEFVSSFAFEASHITSGGDERLFTKDELLKYKYKYLAIVGEVFYVANAKGIRHYGADGGYNFFTGIDGTRAFVTGDFTEKGLIDDISGLPAQDIRSIEDWRLMYHKDYTPVGKVVGRFYDSDGKETEEKIKYRKLLKIAEKEKLAQKELLKVYPPCNSEFKNKGSRVWCSTSSGGIKRSWAGVPRKLFTAGTGEYRCACIRTTGPPSADMNSENHKNRGDLDNPNLGIYGECNPTAESCPI